MGKMDMAIEPEPQVDMGAGDCLFSIAFNMVNRCPKVRGVAIGSSLTSSRLIVIKARASLLVGDFKKRIKFSSAMDLNESKLMRSSSQYLNSRAY